MENTSLERLNDKQKEAVLQVDGPLLILAGAGSGKTSTMTHRIAHMIREEGIADYNILAVTFTNKAAGEMRERVEDLLGGPTRVWIMTFHAACLRILRRHADILGYTSSFTVYDPVDTKTVVKGIIKDLGIDEKQFSVAGLLAKISDCKNEKVSPREYRDSYGTDFRENVIYQVYDSYERILKQNNAMDFDDLLLNVVRLFAKSPAVLAYYQNRFRYVMVDEYQDTNRVQYEFVHALAAEHGNICVVGDDDQCIYQWRGADIRNILDFEKDFPGAKVIKLEQNYRSTGIILQAAHSIISQNRQRKDKRLWTDQAEGDKIVYRRAENERDEAWYVAQEIGRLKTANRSYSDFAVLYRTNAQSRTFEDALSARDIPYRVVGGVRYYERKEIKDMVAYLRLVENPNDALAFARIINEPKRGIGATTQKKLQALAEYKGATLFEILQDPDVVGGLSAKASGAVASLMKCLVHYHEERDNLRVSDIYDGLLQDTGYMKALEDMHNTEGDSRLENLLEFRSVIYDYEAEDNPYYNTDDQEIGANETGNLKTSVAASHNVGGKVDSQGRVDATLVPFSNGKSLAEFLEKIALLADVDNHDPRENAVVLMTLHSAKGLEFPFVFMPGMEDGLFPGWRSLDSPEKLEEERRLCYVGITRAKERLCMVSCEYRTMYGRGSYTRESTFLREMDPRLITGDGVYQERQSALHGREVGLDGYAKEVAYDPFAGKGAKEPAGVSRGTKDGFVAVKKEIKQKKAPLKLEAGDRVCHGKFGEGLVIEVQGNVVSVMFDEVGLKKLAADVAPLKKI